MVRRSLLHHFADLPDPRIDRTKKHRLDEVLLIALTATVCGASSFEEIGAFVLRRATEEATRWPHGISIAVNLSPAQFKSGAVSEAVREALQRSGLEPARLELEITESVLLDQTSGSISVLEALHAQGVRVALDDFGTGYS